MTLPRSAGGLLTAALALPTPACAGPTPLPELALADGTSGSADAGTTSGDSTSGFGPSTGRGSSSEDGVDFVHEPDFGDGLIEDCDVFAQDCPAGLKCMPWANDGGSSWNGTRCSPIADDPGAPGESCTVEGSGVSGIDSCRLGAMCWDVSPETEEGVCIELCTGDPSTPVCDDPGSWCQITSQGAILPCIPRCDPIAQDCPERQGCYAAYQDWGCLPDASRGLGAYGDPCEYPNACDPGLLCLAAAATPDCTGAAGCCAEVCDLEAPSCTGAPDGVVCRPWYEPGTAPPGLENVGACALP